jgi:uncharacterized iron-regulated membrane protein
MLHGWLGLGLGLVLAIICGSGAVAVFGHEIDWLLDPALRVEPGQKRASLDALHAEVARTFPQAKIAWWQLQSGPRFADEVEIYPQYVDRDHWGEPDRVYVDPYRGVIQGAGRKLAARSFLRAFHYYWFDTRLGWGFYLVASFAFVLLGSVLTGMAIYRRWWQGLVKLRFRSGKRILFSDLHRFCGAWTLVFNFIIALTAVYYLVEWIGGGHDWEKQTPVLSAERVARLPAGAARRSLDSQVATARAVFPDLRIANISLPVEPDDPLYFDGQATAWFVRERGNKLLLDPYDGMVVHQHRAEDLSVGHRWVETVDVIHFGNFGGLVSKILWCVFGLMLPALFVTGAWLGIRRGGRLSWKQLRDLRRPLNAIGLSLSLALVAFAALSTAASVKESLARPATTDSAADTATE